MKHRFLWAGALALAVTVCAPVKTLSQVILILTRKDQDQTWYNSGANDTNDPRGPGNVALGDAAMQDLLGDYGYSCRLTLNANLNAAEVNPCTALPGDVMSYLQPTSNPQNSQQTGTNLYVNMVIVSGSGNSGDDPLVAGFGVPVMCGEQYIIGDRSNKAGSLFMYSNGTDSAEYWGPNGNPAGSQYMTVLAPNHPIMAGIPLDSQGRVKIIRDPYPEEGAHLAPSAYGLANYEYDIPGIPVADAAPGTTVLGVLDNNPSISIFAVVDVGGTLSNGAMSTERLVHFFVNEDGGNSPRRCFNTLTDLGRVIFVRAAKWAMGETLAPYKPLGIIDVSQVGQSKIKVSWQGSADKNYKILGTTDPLGPADFSNWQTVSQDIAGTNGIIARTLDISQGPQVAFLRVQPVP
jgi:hypothetical protein